MDLQPINDRLAEIHRGRKWILCVEVAAGSTAMVDRLGEWGVDDVLVVAGAEGAGEVPERNLVWAQTEPADTLMGGIREYFRALLDPVSSVMEAVQQFDPGGEALVLVPDYHRAERILGRRVYSSRPASIEALEDKTVVDDLWDSAGVERAPVEVVDVAEAPAAAERLAGPLGSVWAADNKLGWHGGGSYTKWIGPDSNVAAAVEWFSTCAQRVRVMPFLDGIPCSIHGFVGTTGIAVFRPCEMVTLRNTRDRTFVYGGVATFWDPLPDDREAMRGVARSVAELLRAEYDFLGPFSVDGVMTVDGFRPTELNPRMSAGMGRLASTVPDLSLGAMAKAMREGDLVFDAAGLEPLIVEASDLERAGGAYTVVQGVPAPQAAVESPPTEVVFEDGRVRPVAEDEVPTGTIEVGNNPAGAFARFVLDPEQVPAGPSIGPMGVALADFIRAEWGLDLGPVEAAPDLRR